MDEKVVNAALNDCDGDLEAAIKTLNQLTLAHGAREAISPVPTDASETPKSQEEADAELEKWSEAICAEMAAAVDVSDARLRAKRFLARCRAHIEAAQKAKSAASIEQLAKENVLLKRAVAIQHSRMTAAADKEQQLSQLQAMLGQYQERVRALEMSNYSLSLHLKQATSGHVSAMGGGPPDIC